jgi:hypothetical protein
LAGCAGVFGALLLAVTRGCVLGKLSGLVAEEAGRGAGWRLAAFGRYLRIRLPDEALAVYF